jgi:hypothetical protein
MLVAVGIFMGFASITFAQQSPPQPAVPSQATPGKSRTIDCPATAVPGEAATQARSSPQGSGSGLMAMPSVGPPQRVEGAITTIDSSRTNRILQVGEIKLEVEPGTLILVGCQPATVANLQQGTKIKAMYEVKEPNRTVATVIEAER